MELLAHRGVWTERAERNAPHAVARAFSHGWGIETDIRDLAGRVAISHDAPSAAHEHFLEDLLASWRAHGCPGRLALNVKADGLQDAVASMLLPGEPERCFVFDASVPDERQWLRAGVVPVFVRHSELEPAPAASPHYRAAAGVWLDAFEGDWWDGAVVREHLAAGKLVAIVSPELHGRAQHDCWRALADAGLWHEPGVMLCTDLPHEAAAFG